MVKNIRKDSVILPIKNSPALLVDAEISNSHILDCRKHPWMRFHVFLCICFLSLFFFVRELSPTSQPPQCFSQATQCPSNSVGASSQHVPARKENGHLSTFSSPLSGSQWEIYLHLLLLHWIRGKYRVTCTNLSASSCQMLAFMFGKVE